MSICGQSDMDVVLYAGRCIDRLKRINISMCFFLVLVVEIVNKLVGYRVNVQLAAISQCAQASARNPLHEDQHYW